MRSTTQENTASLRAGVRAVASAAAFLGLLTYGQICGAADPPADVQTVAKLAAVVARHQSASEPPEPLAEALVQAQWALVIAALDRSDALRTVAARLDELGAIVRADVGARLDRAYEAPVGDRRHSLIAAAVRLATSARRADDVIASWLGLPALGTVLDLDDDRTTTAPALTAQLLAQQTPGDVAISVADSALIEEVGGAGQGNGYLDAGEWIHLRLRLVNFGEVPWFSTSAWFRPKHPCLWVQTAQEHEVGEMPAGAHADVKFWMYVGQTCGAGAAPTLDVVLRDTQRATTDYPLPLRVTPYPLTTAKLDGVLIDVDVPGSSDGTRRTTLAPSMRFEVSAGLAVSAPDATAGRNAYAVPAASRDLLSSLTTRTAPLQRTAPGKFEAGDDADAVVAAESAYVDALDGAGRQEWVSLDGGVLWVGVESEVERPAPGGPRPSRSVPPPSPARRVPEDDVVVLVRTHVALRARPTPTRLDDAVEATDGYEVVFDDAAFRKDYQAAGAPASAASAPAPPPAAARYLFRHVVAVPVEGRAPPPPPPAQRPVVRRRPRPVRLPAPPEEPIRVSLDLGVGYAVHSAKAPPILPDLWGGETTAETFSGRVGLVFGSGPVGLVGLDAGAGGPLTEFAIHGCIGGLVKISGAADLVPYAGLLLSGRSVSDQTADIVGNPISVETSNAHLGVLGGLRLRVGPPEGVGLLIDAHVGVTEEGPDAERDATLGGNYFRLTVGLSINP